jgi:hypothetical protein
MFGNNSGKPKLYLLIDRDDLTVKSAPIIQGIINDNTNFKTDVLHMFEQLRRNCRYFLDEIIKLNNPEKNFIDYNAAMCYYNVADRFLNWFLEERDTFLEIDNMPKGTRKYFNYEKEMAVILELSELIDKNRDAFHRINVFCLNRLEKLIEEAKRKKTIPNYGALISLDSNDIIKHTSIDEEAAVEHILYEKPLELLRNCIKNENRMHDIITNACVFYQPSGEIIDYSSIHCMKNVNTDAVNLINEMCLSGRFYHKYESSHQTGKREDDVKDKTSPIIVPMADGYFGQRFHTDEHDANRRGRSSKVERAVLILGIDPAQVVLIDDSIANCLDCVKRGGTAILYKPMTDAEKIKGKLEDTGVYRLTTFSDFDTVDQAIDEAEQKVKRMTR